MNAMSIAIFEILERAWARLDCTLVDMKIEFGLCWETGRVLLADVIDNDAWRVWPAGDRRLMKDKQVYRDLKEVTPEALQEVLKNFEWVRDAVRRFTESSARAVVFAADKGREHQDAVWGVARRLAESYSLKADIRFVPSPKTSAASVLDVVASLQGHIQPTVLVVVDAQR
jgi:phosphoribosylaminoimidazole carboxylase/phosphoribosylaminoimidazole-succinocarboxamide synthase